jgi:hypothetical protein
MVIANISGRIKARQIAAFARSFQARTLSLENQGAAAAVAASATPRTGPFARASQYG